MHNLARDVGGGTSREAAYRGHRSGSRFKLLNPFDICKNESTSADQKTAVLARLANTRAASYNNKTTTDGSSPCRRSVRVPSIPTFRHVVRVMMKTTEKRFRVRITPRLSHICGDKRAHPSIRGIVLLILLLSVFSTLACRASVHTVNACPLADWR